MGANFPWVSGTAMLLSFITFWCAVCPGLAGSAPLATTNLPLSLIPATHAPSPFGGIPARHEPNGWSEARVEQDVQGGGVRVEQDVQARTEVGGGGRPSLLFPTMEQLREVAWGTTSGRHYGKMENRKKYTANAKYSTRESILKSEEVRI